METLNVTFGNGYMNDVEAVELALEELAQKHFNSATLTIENDGIGFYEYWGQKGFHRGTDSLLFEPEQDEITVKIPTTDFSGDREDLQGELSEYIYVDSGTLEGSVNDVNYHIVLNLVSSEIVFENGVFFIVVKYEWKDIN